MTQPSHTSHIPESYEGRPAVQNFEARAHHLSEEQAREVVSLAEASHHDTQGKTYTRSGNESYGNESYGNQSYGNQSYGNQQSGTGAGTAGFGTREAENVAGTLGSRDSTSGSGLGSGTHHGLSSGSGAGVGQAMHTGSRDTSSYDDNERSRSSGLGSNAGLAGAGASAGAVGAGAYYESSSRGGNSGSTNSAVDAKQKEGRGGELYDNSSFSNPAPKGTLEHKLQDELERNARKAGTHAAGFGVLDSNQVGLGSNNSGSTGGYNSGSTGGYSSGSTGGVPGYNSSSTGGAPGYNNNTSGQSTLGKAEQYVEGRSHTGAHANSGLATEYSSTGPTQVGHHGMVQEVERRAVNQTGHGATGLGSQGQGRAL